MAARKTAADKKAAEVAAKAAAKAVNNLTPQDAHNLLNLINRVQVQGIQEAQYVSYIAQKLASIKGDFTPEA